MQTRLESLIETIVNILIGYFVSLGAQFVIFPLLDIPVTFGEQIIMSLFFTAISIVRMYTIRRYFNGRLKNFSHTLATGIHNARH